MCRLSLLRLLHFWGHWGHANVILKGREREIGGPPDGSRIEKEKQDWGNVDGQAWD